MNTFSGLDECIATGFHYCQKCGAPADKVYGGIDGEQIIRCQKHESEIALMVNPFTGLTVATTWAEIKTFAKYDKVIKNKRTWIGQAREATPEQLGHMVAVVEGARSILRDLRKLIMT